MALIVIAVIKTYLTILIKLLFFIIFITLNKINYSFAWEKVRSKYIG